jgi:hypothetical protein
MLDCPLSLPFDTAPLAFEKGLFRPTWLKNVLPDVGIDVKPSSTRPFALKLEGWFDDNVERHYGQEPSQKTHQGTTLANTPCSDAWGNLGRAGVEPSSGDWLAALKAATAGVKPTRKALICKALRKENLDGDEKGEVETLLGQVVTIPTTPKRKSDAPSSTLQPLALGLDWAHFSVLC